MVKKTLLIALLTSSGLVAQAPVDPSTLPLVQLEDLQYAGSFKAPTDYDYGGRALAFNPAGPSLFLGGPSETVGEINIPTPVKGELSALPRATARQARVSIFGSHGNGIGAVPANRNNGLLVLGDRLLGSGYNYFDANNDATASHFSHSTTLSDSASFRGWSRVWQERRQGLVAGAMAHVPLEWQSRLGGAAITGQCCIPITSRTSWGPAAFAFDPARIGEPRVAATPLVYYDGDHMTLGSWSNQGPLYGMGTLMGGMVIVPGTRTLLFIGSNGTPGTACYGDATSDPKLHRKQGPAGLLCYDRANGTKVHAYPYNTQVWAYDLNDLAAVKAGKRRPWQVKPYGAWHLTLPVHPNLFEVGAVTIDPVTRRIYLTQYKGEWDEIGGGVPLIHTYDVKVGSAPPLSIPSRR